MRDQLSYMNINCDNICLKNVFTARGRFKNDEKNKKHVCIRLLPHLDMNEKG